MWKALEVCTEKVVKCCEQSLEDLSSTSLGDSSAEENVDCGGPGEEDSEGNNIRNWAGGQYVLFWQRICLHSALMLKT